jgi:hypothetical protein
MVLMEETEGRQVVLVEEVVQVQELVSKVEMEEHGVEEK